MEKVILWKRSKQGPKPMRAPWMRTDSEDETVSERDVAHAYAAHIGNEYARLRARLHKLGKRQRLSILHEDGQGRA